MLGDTIMLSSPELKIWSSAKEAYDAGNTTSGFYSIQLSGWASPQQIYCDMVNNGGGWMLWYNRTAQAPIEYTLDLRTGPTGVGHWSGWENDSAPGLITGDWTDLNTEGYKSIFGVKYKLTLAGAIVIMAHIIILLVLETGQT
jgi:hypothetical protein